jgi:hypothetical protein
MAVPILPPRVEKYHHLSADDIDSAEIWTFAEITPDARQRQIVQIVGAAVLEWNDVLDLMMPQEHMLLPQPTVFTTVARSFLDRVAFLWFHS